MSTTYLDIYNKSLLLNTNTKSEKYGLKLSNQDVQDLLESRERVLKDYERTETSADALKNIIEYFCESSYLQQDEYTETIADIQTLYYHLLNDQEGVPDAAIIEVLKRLYDNECKGSIILLKDALLNFNKSYAFNKDIAKFEKIGE